MDALELDSEVAEATEADPELDELVAKFGHRVRYFACRIERRFGLGPQWRDDLISSGYWGLFKALRNRRSVRSSSRDSPSSPPQVGTGLFTL